MKKSIKKTSTGVQLWTSVDWWATPKLWSQTAPGRGAGCTPASPSFLPHCAAPVLYHDHLFVLCRIVWDHGAVQNPAVIPSDTYSAKMRCTALHISAYAANASTAAERAQYKWLGRVSHNIEIPSRQTEPALCWDGSDGGQFHLVASSYALARASLLSEA